MDMNDDELRAIAVEARGQRAAAIVDEARAAAKKSGSDGLQSSPYGIRSAEHLKTLQRDIERGTEARIARLEMALAARG